MYRFLIIIEKTKSNFSAYAPDLLGCVATGKTKEEVEINMHKAIEMHLKGLKEEGLAIPKSKSFAEFIVFKEIT